MTVQTQQSQQNYNGNGVTTVFAVPFRFLANSHISVRLQPVDRTQPAILWVEGADYTLNGARSQSGGAVTATVAPANGTILIITRNVPLTQLIDYRANDPFPEESAENGLDQLTMAIQQVSGQLAGTFRLPSYITGVSTELPQPSPLSPLVWSVDGLRLENGSTNLSGDLLLRGNLADGTTPGRGSALVAFKQTGTGAVSRTLESKLQDTISVFDFMTPAQRADVLAGTLSIDVTAACQAALNTGAVVEFPVGKYRITSSLTLSAGGGIQGDGERTQLIRAFSGGSLIRHPGGNQLGDPIILRDFAVDTQSGITVTSADTGIEIGYAAPWAQRGDISNITIIRQWDGFKWTGGTMGNISSVQCLEGKGRGFVGINARGELNSCLSQFNASHGYFIYAQTVGETGIQFTSCGTFANGGWGYLFDGAVNGANIYMKGVSSSTDAAGGIGFARKFEQIWMTQILIESAGDANFQRPDFPLVNTAVGLYMVGGCEKLVASDIFVQTSRGAGCFFDSLTRASFTNLVCIDSGRGNLGGANAVGINFNANCSDVKMYGLIANFGGFQATDISMSGTTNSVDFFGPSFRTYFTGGGQGARFHGPRTTASAAINAASTTTLVDYADFIAVNGTTNINAITASWPGRRITLMFTGTLTVADGNNLKLNGVFSATPDDTLSLVCDGTNWFEVARSAN